MKHHRHHAHGNGNHFQEKAERLREHLKPLRSRLYKRPGIEGKVFGICAGIADYFGIAAKTVRIVAIVLLIIFPIQTGLLYLFLNWLLDPAPPDLYQDSSEQQFWQEVRVNPRGTSSSLRHHFRKLDHRLQALEAWVTSKEYRMDRELRN